MNEPRTKPIDVKLEKKLLDFVSRFAKDPLGYCKIMYKWNQGELAGSTGPREWQVDILNVIGKHLQNPQTRFHPLQIAVASGHGVGKSALISMVCQWAMSTCPDTKILITANTDTQLRTKTMPEVSKWARLALNSHWFKTTATAIYSADASRERTWRADAVPWSEENTEAFQGLHNKGRRIIFIMDEACHDDQTEVLTNSGWKLFKDLSATDMLLTMDPETQVAEYLYPTAIHATKKEGELIKYNRRGTSFVVTPNHRMFLETQKGVKSFRTAGDLVSKNNLEVRMERSFKWAARDVSEFVLPSLTTARKYFPERKIPMDEFVALLGWYYSEGHLVFGHGRYRSVGFSNNDVSEIIDLCKKCGFSPKKYKLGVHSNNYHVMVNDMQIASWLSGFGVGCLRKRIPDFIRTLSSRQINIFLDAYRKGDGYCRTVNREILYTSNKLIADGLQELIFFAGQRSTIKVRTLKDKLAFFKDHIGISSTDGYVVSRSWDDAKINLKTKYLEKVKYSGMVYCATLPKHGLLFTRRDGVCMWSGNSAISDKIWEVAEGALTDADTEIIWIAFGNPTRNTGRFRACFSRYRHRWVTRQIDNRKVEGTNVAAMQNLIDDYGEDSDFVRVRIKGEFPRAGTQQFIPSDIVEEATHREPSSTLMDPLILGVDCARSLEEDQSVLCVRRGRDARSVPWVKIRTRDTMVIADHIVKMQMLHHFDAIFIDGGSIGGGVIDYLRRLGYNNVIEVQFAAAADKSLQTGEGVIGYANKRAEMWGAMRDWLKGGAIPDDSDLVSALTSVNYIADRVLNKKEVILLEKKSDMKKRGLCSPDEADALAVTFFMPVVPRDHSGDFGPGAGRGQSKVEVEYDPFSRDRVVPESQDRGGPRDRTFYGGQ